MVTRLLKSCEQAKPLRISLEFAELEKFFRIESLYNFVVAIVGEPATDGFLSGMSKRRVANVMCETSIANDLGDRMNELASIARQAVIPIDKARA
jgi:hypothetical protein